jgi:hypothetical protein
MNGHGYGEGDNNQSRRVWDLEPDAGGPPVVVAIPVVDAQEWVARHPQRYQYHTPGEQPGHRAADATRRGRNAPMSDLGTISSYDDLHAALRRRADELKLSRRTIDDLAGLADGYVEKLLGPRQVKKFSVRSLGAILSALGVKLVLVEDPIARAAIDLNEPKRCEYQVRYATNGAETHV